MLRSAEDLGETSGPGEVRRQARSLVSGDWYDAHQLPSAAEGGED